MDGTHRAGAPGGGDDVCVSDPPLHLECGLIPDIKGVGGALSSGSCRVTRSQAPHREHKPPLSSSSDGDAANSREKPAEDAGVF